VVSLWEGSRHDLVDRFGLSPAAVRVVPTAVPADRFPPVDEHMRAVAGHGSASPTSRRRSTSAP
jgi:hypothetical protein